MLGMIFLVLVLIFGFFFFRQWKAKGFAAAKGWAAALFVSIGAAISDFWDKITGLF